MTVIVAKKGRPPPCKHSNNVVSDAELAYLNGESGKKADVGCRVMYIRPGDYYVFYK